MPGGNSVGFALLNSATHVVTYIYYMLAALGPQMKKYLWWKQYLTTLQGGGGKFILKRLIYHMNERAAKAEIWGR